MTLYDSIMIAQETIKRMWEMVPSGLSDNEPTVAERDETVRRGLPPALPQTDTSNLQNLYLTMGSLALQAGNPELALRDLAQGVELTLCGQELTVSASASGSDITVFYSFKDLFQVIIMHLQYAWLENTGDFGRRLKIESALLEVTKSEYDIVRFRTYTLS